MDFKAEGGELPGLGWGDISKYPQLYTYGKNNGVLGLESLQNQATLNSLKDIDLLGHTAREKLCPRLHI